MTIRRLPDLTPEQVAQLQDALLENADTLLNSAIAVLELGHVSLARSLAILGLEESGKAIAIHERRVALEYAPDGELFRCEELDKLWASHEKKLEAVHNFLLEEPYWFDTEAPDYEENSRYLGTIKSWSRRHDRSKQRGFYVDLSKTGQIMAPTDMKDESALREVLAHVHQIGWQLRLGEHIEGKRQDEREAGVPAASEKDLALLNILPRLMNEHPALYRSIRDSLGEGIPGEVLPNAAYRFNPPGKNQEAFRNLAKRGHEAETREVLRLAQELSQSANEHE
ncbi:AbiV family abortive infection protein [Glutamicibacter ardleyensis]|uniref:AbiV family abortive infection protein n=1 Tax=Glutamicibacter ardleyensis TaxID=225894 RepID=A0ABQ2DD35_9MICC|nr:AbiV family abortive infection protein [Glutamicibacter ardleyensis]GGJ53948.1 hypothetical protein GCM10007173_10610 [Glutamicibacter ardleyensis]